MRRDCGLQSTLLITLLAFCVGSLLSGCIMEKKDLSPEGMVLVPAGPFIMGSNQIDREGRAAEFGIAKPLYLDEHPEQKVHLPAFYIDRYEVTNRWYTRFAQATRSRTPINWPKGRVPPGREDYPVTEVNWYDADRFCRWMGKHLPTEAQWEKAARGPDGRQYPWGQEFDKNRANTGESGYGDLTPVGSFESGKSPYGVYDMSGNVWEWVEDWYQPYPKSPYQSDSFGEKFKILRGTSWGGVGHYALAVFYRSAYRFYATPEKGYPDAGFRCAKEAQGALSIFASSLKI